jgi:hypothetical protein
VILAQSWVLFPFRQYVVSFTTTHHHNFIYFEVVPWIGLLWKKRGHSSNRWIDREKLTDAFLQHFIVNVPKDNKVQ